MPSNPIMAVAAGGGGRAAGEGLKQILAKVIQQADQVGKLAEGSQSCRQECADVKSKVERLAALLRQAARASDLYERPARRIFADTEQVLDKALSLVDKCRPHGIVKRVFTIIPPTAFKKMSTSLDNSLGDVSWLLRASSPSVDDDDDDGMLLGLPPIAQNEPILFLIWEHIATLHTTASLDARSDSAAALASLAANDRYSQLIIQEDGIGPLLRLVREGRVEGQENAARALGLLARDPDSIEAMLEAGACAAFAKVLRDGPMRAQAAVAWAVAELAAGYPKSQDLFAQNNVIRLLVGHLAFETVEEHSRYTILATSTKPMSIHSIVLANTKVAAAGEGDGAVSEPKNKRSSISHPMVNLSQMDSGERMHTVIQSTMTVESQQQQISTRGMRESEDPATKAQMKAMAARALWRLAKGNPGVCKNLTESRALLCFAVLLEKGPGKEVRYNSAMALMEIARVAEHNSELRRSAFKPKSPAARAVVDQLLRVVQGEEREEEGLLAACVTALGCLSRMFQATETRLIAPLVMLLEEREGSAGLAGEAAIALTKFACTENYLHVGHSRAIVEAGGVEHLVQLVYLGKQVQVEALVLLCYLAMHVPDMEELSAEQGGAPAVLAWACKQGHLVQDSRVDSLLPEARARLELYQTRGSATTGFL